MAKKKLTKKQIKINKQERHKKTKTYHKKQERLKLKKLDTEWAKAVKNKYNNKCALCGNEKLLNAHHIIPREIKETRHMIENGVALCPKHHKFDKTYSAHRNPLWFIIQLEKVCPDDLRKLMEIANRL